MATPRELSERRSAKALSLAAFILFLIGFILPLFRFVLILPWALIGVAWSADFVAMVLGVMTWRRNLSKIAAIGAAVLCFMQPLRYALVMCL
jgi:hypothetical protein